VITIRSVYSSSNNNITYSMVFC